MHSDSGDKIMAIFGNMDVIKQQASHEKFKRAFEYLEVVVKTASNENKRLLALEIGAFEKVDLNDANFALEQVYYSKNRNECFFESHKDYIDVQFILDGEEIIEVCNVDQLVVDQEYDKTMDLIKYYSTEQASKIRLKKGDVAIFYPEDGHMPCVQVDDSVKVVKTVVKVAV